MLTDCYNVLVLFVSALIQIKYSIMKGLLRFKTIYVWVYGEYAIHWKYIS